MESQDDHVLVHLELCNNITSCDIGITRGSLNIKYAINGTGKSTVGKAIFLSSQNKPLSPLKPFQLPLGIPASTLPTATGVEFSNVMLFDGDYVSQYIFQPSDLVKNAFEIFIRTEDYDSYKTQIDADCQAILKMFAQSSVIRTLADSLRELCNLVKINSDGRSISKRARGVKNTLESQKCALSTPPDNLSEFKPFFSDGLTSVDWAAWKLIGIDKYSDKGICPFCAEPETGCKKEQTRLFSESFDKDSITFTSKLKENLEKLSTYINPEKLNSLLRLLSIDGDRSTFELQLVKLLAEAQYILDRLNELATFSGYSVDRSRLGELVAILTDKKIDTNILDYFNTDNFRSDINPLNEKVDEIISAVSRLQENIAHLQACLQRQVASRTKDINEFLLSAGFKYSFDIKIDGDGQAHALLLYNGIDETQVPVDKPAEHLSWGERNVFSLLLFMFDAISKDADLIILDDPISSFDSSKKYAIINRLFMTGSRGNSLYMRTVLLLTHDMEPVIDYIQVGGKLDNRYVNGFFMQNLDGLLAEYSIHKDVHILSTIILMKQIAKDENTPLPARIGCLRKYIEHTTADPSVESISYNILSSLIHNREHPTYDNNGEFEMSSDDLIAGIEEIVGYIPSFNYQVAKVQLEGKTLLEEFQRTSNMYIRLLILRMFVQRYSEAKDRLKARNDVLRKYIDETFHIENDYLYSFDFRRFAVVPEYISKAASDFVVFEYPLWNT